MSTNWRISSFSGALLAAYFIPVWTSIAFQIIEAPVRGLYDRPSVSIGFFISDHLHLSGIASVRIAWLLALARITTVAFFALYLVLLSSRSVRERGGGDETLGMALALGSVLSFVSMLAASAVGEAEALRLHATELLMLLGIGIVLLIEGAAPRMAEVRNEADAVVPAGNLSLQQP
ncbi:hypothetical protein I6F35_19575 [Bradyrhizobium sp. BRP22]|uniref:hypothetical protein n=1 Tax=Bradyrhizobium sp. BRP22 TaxID=2793821 RepID=UPI001CD647AE|nr:hypothetical protein [Bradyrhizobium sp. BRP22]MCA1455390.1 hypothetical protein [Bradyrhizobium sp. BRP22]